LGAAVRRGARVHRELVQDVAWDGEYPRVKTSAGNESAYDLVAVATGVNSNFIRGLDLPSRPFEPPDTTRAFVCEFRSTEDEISKVLGNAVHVFLLELPRVEFAAIVPKGRYATVIMVGEDIDRDLVQTFLQDPVVRACFPTGAVPCVCTCSPLINLSPSVRPYADRMVMIGDSGVTRLYKDGIGAAFRTGKAAATAAVFHGVSADDFESHFWPACRTIRNDNRIGAVLFGLTGLFKRARYLRRIMFNMARREQANRKKRPHMSTLLWNMFTGSAPYTEICRAALHPGFAGNMLVNMMSSLVPDRPGDERVSVR
jgi:flavin-dependent dehydrogenase